MILRSKLMPVALGAALLGGSVGALVMRPAKTNETASTPAAQQAAPATTGNSFAATGTAQPLVASNDENAAYREGFTEGVRAAREEGLTAANVSVAPRTAGVVAARPVATRTRYVRSRSGSAERRVYYDYSQPRKRSFWSKHRDKLTVAAGAGGGALIGGLVGGKKGALIGALAGGGGSALYTYKLRKRNRNY